MNLTDEQLELLPETIRSMVQRIGLANTLVVVKKLGGTTWRVADGKTDDGRKQRKALADLVGEAIEAALHQHYAGADLYIAQCRALMTGLRDAAIHQEFDHLIRQGISARTVVTRLARQHRLSDRWIWEILNKVPVSSPQTELFDGL